MSEEYWEFTRKMHWAIHESQLLGYYPTRFLEMVKRLGFVEACRTVIHKKNPQGFYRLWSMGKIDISIEAIIHDNPQFHKLFRQSDLDAIIRRLTEYKYLKAVKHDKKE